MVEKNTLLSVSRHLEKGYENDELKTEKGVEIKESNGDIESKKFDSNSRNSTVLLNMLLPGSNEKGERGKER